MYVIQYTDGKYVKKTATKVTMTFNEHIADRFKTVEEANKFIDNYISKKRRRSFVIQESTIKDEQITLKPTKNIRNSTIYEKLEDMINNCIENELVKLENKIARYDDMILDIRHYIRNKNTKLNTVYGYKIIKLMQDIERKRLDCKYEIARIEQLKSRLVTDLNKFDKFEFEEYKPRVITNIDDYINGNKEIE